MSSIKQYTIQINGIKESTDAVEALSKQLDNLEQRIDKLNQKGVTVGGSLGKTSDLTAEQKIADQINQSIEKRVALQGELGKELANEKQLMKEVNAEAKAAAASDRLANGGYSNTMMGLKQELYDIKAAMQTTDLGSDSFTQMAQRADELNTKLKEIEQSYGQFGRNVGNYSNSIQEAFQQITVKVGDTEMKFNSTKEALRTMREGLKSMVINGKEGTDEFDNMAKALHDLEMAADRADSAVQDLQKSSTGMDDALDFMQSFGALGQISQGFSSMFGGTGFEESIQKMMSLQSVLQGIEKIREQMNTGEGFGKVFGSISKGADDAAAKLLRVKGGMDGLGNASKVTQFAVKGLSTVMKGLGGLGIGLLIDGAMKLADKVGGFISKWLGGNEALIDSNKAVANSINLQNQELEEEEKQLRKNLELGNISSQQYFDKMVEKRSKAIEELLDEYDRFVAADEDLSGRMRKNLQEGIRQGEGIGMKRYNTPRLEINDDAEGAKMAKLYNDALKDRITIWEEMAKQGIDTSKEFAQGWREMNTDIEDSSVELQHINAVAMGEIRKKVGEAMATMRTDVEGGRKKFDELLKLLESNDWYKTALNFPEDIINSEGFKKIINSIKEQIYGLKNMFSSGELGEFEKRQLGIDAMADGTEKALAQIELNYDKAANKYAQYADEEIQVGNTTMKVWEALELKRQNDLQKAREGGAKKTISTAKSTGKKVVDIEKEIQRAKLDAMADGLTKEITKLEQERNERLKRVEGNKQAEADINTYYNRKIADEQKKWHKEIEDGYRDMWNNIFSFTIETTSKLISTNESAAQRIYEDMIEYNEGLWENYFDSAAKVLNDDENLNLMKPLDVFKARIEQLNNVYEDAANESIEKLRQAYDLKNELLQKQKDKELQETSEWYNESIDQTNEYYDKLIDDTREKIKQLRDEEEKDNLQSDIEIWEQERTDRVLEIREQFYSRRSAIDKEYEEKQNELERQQYQDSDRLNKDHIDKQLGELRAFYNEINKLSDAQPVRNAFGFIKVGDTNKINKEVLDSLEEYKTQLQGLGTALNILRETNSITYSTWYTANEEINRQIEGINSKIKETKANLSWEGKLQDFFQTFSQYFSEVTSAIQQVWGELDNLANYNLDRQQDALDKENEMLQDKLDEQEEILERHKDRVDSIEGQLADARGDRRERLIDALNEEIIAQRRAQAEKERLEKEQKKLEEKQKDLDYQRELNQYYSGLRGILFNTAQAVMSAATNKWPVPAIPLMTLAGAAGAAQYAIAHQQRPIKRAEGGLLMGASHANGGIPVGGTGIEVEGGEYVIRKSSTADNIELLDYINDSKRKLTAIDMLEFFRNGGKTIINNTSKTRFADGGVLDISDYPNFNIGSAFEAYSNRPVVVSVVDINQRQSEVRNVEVLAGLN